MAFLGLCEAKIALSAKDQATLLIFTCFSLNQKQRSHLQFYDARFLPTHGWHLNRHPLYPPSPVNPKLCTHPVWTGLARTIYIRCKYGIFGRKSTKYKVTYGVYGPVLANPRCDPWGWPLPDQGLSATHTKHTPAHTLGTQSVPFTL